MTNQIRFIALGHQARVGKDTFAEYVRSKVTHCYVIAFSDDLYICMWAIQDALGVPRHKDPKLLQSLGEGMKTVYGSDIWVNRVEQRIIDIMSRIIHDITTAPAKSITIVVTDMRFKTEREMLLRNNFKTIKITRKNRVIDRDPNHISEIDLQDEPFDYHIANDGTVEEFYAQIDAILGL